MQKTPGGRAGRSFPVLPVVWPVLLLLAALAMSARDSTAFAAEAPSAGGRAVVTNTDGDPIRVRQGAGTKYPQVESVYEGQVVSVLAGPSTDPKGDKWFKIQAPSAAGWVAAIYLQATGAPSTTTRKLTGSARVANTDGDSLRVRAAPTAGPAGEILALLDPSTTVTILTGPLTDDGGVVWYEIKAGGITGWAMAQYLAPAETAQVPAASPRAESVAARTTPAKAAPSPTPAAAPPAPKPTSPPKKPANTPTAAPVAAGPAVAAARPTATAPIAATPAQLRQWIEEARKTFPYSQSADRMWSVMMCESGGNSRAVGGGGAYLGLFQYSPATWAGAWNPYRGSSIWDARSQIFATAKAWSIGMQGSWSCFYSTSGN